jgi:hypothetical protein
MFWKKANSLNTKISKKRTFMKYDYKDSFITNGIDEIYIEALEEMAIYEVVEKYKIIDEFYIQKLVTSKVYMKLAQENLESEGMRDKFNFYKNEFDFYYRLAKSANSGISNIPIARS